MLHGRKGPPHRVGVDYRTVQRRTREKRLQGVAAADLDAHQRIESPPEMRFHPLDRAGDHRRIGEPLLADQRRAHLAADADQVVVPQTRRIHEPRRPAGVEQPAHVEQPVPGVAAPARAEDPRADREEFEVRPRQDPLRPLAHTPENGETNGRSNPKADGPAWTRPFSDRKTGGEGIARTVTRWP